MTLNDIKPGEKAIIKRLDFTGGIKRRLLDIGLINETTVECIGKSPAGDPKAYLIRGAVIAIRTSDAHRIHVAKSEEVL